MSPAAQSPDSRAPQSQNCQGKSFWLGHDRQLALRLVQHVADARQVEHAPLTQLGVHVVVGEPAPAQLVAPQLPVRDQHPHPVVGELPEQGPEPEQAREFVDHDQRQQRHRPGQVRLRTRDRGAPDDRAHGDRGGEVDDRPLRQGAALPDPQPHQRGDVHEGRLGHDGPPLRPLTHQP